MTESVRSISNEWSRSASFKFGLVALYALGVGLTLGSHAMWRDEIQAWLVARDSATVSALLRNLSYEGHPALWYLLLMPLTRLGRDPFLMQMLHWAIATATVVLVLWRAPLSRVEQVLFPFGYFIFFEYAVKSRSYALGVLLVMAFCAMWRQRRQHPVVVGFILALMVNVHALTMIVSMAACLALACDRLVHTSYPERGAVAGRSWDVLACCVVGTGWLAAAFTALPPLDSGYATGWFLSFSLDRLGTTLLSLSGLLAPGKTPLLAGLAVAAFLFVCPRAKESPAASVFLGASVIALLAFFYVKHPGGSPHRGLVFVVFFAAVWIDRESDRATARLVSRRALVPSWIFTALLACQAVFGLKAMWGDLHRPLSHGRDVARFIASSGWAGDPIVGLPDHSISTVVGYLGADRAYYANGRRWGSFTVWDRVRLEPVSMDVVLGDVAQSSQAATLIVAAGSEIDPAVLSKHQFSEVARFDGAAMPDENYTVYRRQAATGIAPK